MTMLASSSPESSARVASMTRCRVRAKLGGTALFSRVERLALCTGSNRLSGGELRCARLRHTLGAT